MDVKSRRRRARWRTTALCAMCCCLVRPSMAQTATDELKRMTLEELMAVQVSTVSRVPEPTTAVPAAIHVVTQEDIRRSGAASLAEVLRLVPGIQVARIDSARYAIGIRGFADRLARSMLVLIDGRAVYSPLFAGTYWEVQDTLLEDIERIEVIRGPGGTLWGANAVNGIINIITKRAAETQGFLVTARGGAELRGRVGVRFGGAVGSSFHYRAYAQGFEQDAQLNVGTPEYDDWRMAQSGLRGDWTLSGSRTLTLQGDVYNVRLGQRVIFPTATAPFSETVDRRAPLHGGNVVARWTAPLGRRGEVQLQSFYDRTRRDERPVAETRNTFDIDLQHRTALGTRHSWVWGAGYRVTSDQIDAVPPTRFTPAERTDSLYSAFMQDDFALVRDRVRLIVGTKLLHNPYSGFEIQPSGRILWTMNGRNTFIGSVTRAVRTPSRVETDYETASLANPAIPAFVRLRPNPDFQSEEAIAYELGYRVRPVDTLSLTAASFFNHLENTVSTELLPAFVESTPAPARLILPVTFANGLHGNSHGMEVTADFRPASWWRWTTHYSFLRVQMTRDPGGADVSQERRYEGLSPRHQLQLQSSVDLPRAVSFDWMLRYVSALKAGPVPSYATSNVRLGWRVRNDLEVALVGRDLHQPHHAEFPAGNVQVQRSGFVSLTWRR